MLVHSVDLITNKRTTVGKIISRWLECVFFVCLFVCLFVFSRSPPFFTHVETSTFIYRWRAANFDLCSAATEQWRFFSVPHLLWHGASIYNGHLLGHRTRDIYTYCRALSSGADTTCFYDLGLSRQGFEHPAFRLRGQCSNPVRHCCGKICLTIHSLLFHSLGNIKVRGLDFRFISRRMK